MEKRGAVSPLFHNIFHISLTSRVQLHINLLNMVVWIIFSSIFKIWYVEVRRSLSISESPFEFEISRVDCIIGWHSGDSHPILLRNLFANDPYYRLLQRKNKSPPPPPPSHFSMHLIAKKNQSTDSTDGSIVSECRLRKWFWTGN